MITVLHRGGVCPNDYNITQGGGSLGTPKSDYVICARPLIEGSPLSRSIFVFQNGGRVDVGGPKPFVWLIKKLTFSVLNVTRGGGWWVGRSRVSNKVLSKTFFRGLSRLQWGATPSWSFNHARTMLYRVLSNITKSQLMYCLLSKFCQ